MNLLFCSACLQLFKNKVHRQILRMVEKAKFMIFSEGGCGGVGGGERGVRRMRKLVGDGSTI